MRGFLPVVAVALLGPAVMMVIGCGRAEPRLTQERVLAEAVSSYPDTGAFFVVADTLRPFTPRGYYTTRVAADSVSRSGGYRAYGPYPSTTRDPWRVVAITVRIRTDSGERDVHYDPRTVDAVFLTSSAFRKFMIPYYRHLYGDEVADSVALIIVPPPPRPPTPPCHAMSVPCTSTGIIPLPGGTH